MRMKELINEIDRGKEAGLYQLLKKIPDNEELTLNSVRRVIDNGNGGFTRTELIFLFLESLIKRVKGENSEW